MFVNNPLKQDPGSYSFGGSGSSGGAWGLLEQGIQDTVGFAVGRRDRDHAEHREDRMLREERQWQEDMMNSFLQRRAKDAKKAGLHPLAALGAQVSSPAISSGSPIQPNYPKFGDSGASRVNAAQARLLDKQADLIEQQVLDSQIARATQAATPEKFQVRQQARTGPVITLPLGIDLQTAPTADAQVLEDRYGEIGGSLLGLGNIPADIIHELSKSLERAIREFDPVYTTYE